MTSSKYTAPHVTHQDEVDVTALVDARSTLRREAEAQDIRLTYMPFVMKACAAALQEHPQYSLSPANRVRCVSQGRYQVFCPAVASNGGSSCARMLMPSDCRKRCNRSSSKASDTLFVSGLTSPGTRTVTISNTAGLAASTRRPSSTTPRGDSRARSHQRKAPGRRR